MVRSKIVNHDEGSGSTLPRRTPRSGNRQTKPSRNALNPDFEQRMEDYIEKTVHPERGIDVSELGEVVRLRSWSDYVQHPSSYNVRIVREFYAGMIPENYYKGSAVMVRGKAVKIQAMDIKDYHKTTLENPIPKGVEHQNIFVKKSIDLANSLVTDPMSRWHSKSNPVKQRKLSRELAFWHIFISHSLRPCRHHNTVSFEAAKILYALKTGKDIDVGHLAKKEIYEAGMNKLPNDILPFPCMITQLCKDAGVDMSSPEDEAAVGLPPIMMNARTWKELHPKKSSKGQTSAGEGSRPRQKKRKKAVEEDPSDTEANLEVDEDAAGDSEEDLLEEDDESTTPWRRILAALKLNRDEIHNVERRMNERIDRMEENWRFDLTEMRKELRLTTYSRRRSGPASTIATEAPARGPLIDEEGDAMRRVVELSLKEAEDRAAAERDPKGKRVMSDEE